MLLQVMRETGTSQSELSRISGVRQPSGATTGHDRAGHRLRADARGLPNGRTAAAARTDGRPAQGEL